MPSIKISNLSSAGSELFQDSETFLNELTDREIGLVRGNGVWVTNATSAVSSVITTALSVVSQISISVGVSIQSISVVTTA
jgi:hypothetical protein